MSPLRAGLHEHTHAPTSFVHAVAAACDARGLKLTTMRRRVLELIAVADKPVKAYDLLDQMKATHDAAAPPTVYRALDFLLEHGFIHKLASINAYVGCHHPGSAAHAVPFLICDNCQSATELEDARIVQSLDASARAAGFMPQAQTLEVHGLCASCANAASPG